VIKMSKTNRFIAKPISVEEYLRIRASPGLRLTKTPFGVPPGEERIVGSHAVAWKGKKGKDFWEIAKGHVGAKNVGLDVALKKAIKISQSCAGVMGTEVYGGVLLPKKVVCQKKKAIGE
jgi:hypothetical protein